MSADRVRVRNVPRLSGELIEAYRALGRRDLPDMAGIVARALDQVGVCASIPAAYLPSLTPGRFAVGQAVTVRNIPERELPCRYWDRVDSTRLGEREAFFLAGNGDVIVIDGVSVFPASCLGPMSVALAERLGISGIVVFGAATGVPGIKCSQIPVWAEGGTPLTGHHRLETWEINGAIGYRGVRVEPGDLIVADDSGITVVPFALAEDALERALAMSKKGASMRALIEKGAGREELRTELFKSMESIMGKDVERG